MPQRRTGLIRWLWALGAAFCVAACGTVPGESPEEAFTRCMAARGFEVKDVDFTETERGWEPKYSIDFQPGPGFQQVVVQCVDQALPDDAIVVGG